MVWPSASSASAFALSAPACARPGYCSTAKDMTHDGTSVKVCTHSNFNSPIDQAMCACSTASCAETSFFLCKPLLQELRYLLQARHQITTVVTHHDRQGEK